MNSDPPAADRRLPDRKKLRSLRPMRRSARNRFALELFFKIPGCGGFFVGFRDAEAPRFCVDGMSKKMIQFV